MRAMTQNLNTTPTGRRKRATTVGMMGLVAMSAGNKFFASPVDHSSSGQSDGTRSTGSMNMGSDMDHLESGGRPKRYNSDLDAVKEADLDFDDDEEDEESDLHENKQGEPDAI
jgi:hypothetical protein